MCNMAAIVGGFPPGLTRAVMRVVDGVAKANVAEDVIIHARDSAPITGALTAGADKGHDT